MLSLRCKFLKHCCSRSFVEIAVYYSVFENMYITEECSKIWQMEQICFTMEIHSWSFILFMKYVYALVILVFAEGPLHKSVIN